MKYQKKFRLLSVVLLFAISFCIFTGCQKSTEPPVCTQPVLNERQKDILVSKNLPTDYDQLSVSQQNAILAIEALLQYAEQKYPDETFTFTGEYTPNPEWKPLGGTLTAECSLGIVSISRSYGDHGWEYSDNYSGADAVSEYEQLVGEHLETLLPEVPFVLVAMDVDNPEEGDGSLLSRTNATMAVFLYTTMSKEELKPLVEKYGNWMAEQSDGHATFTGFYIAQDKSTISAISPESVDLLLQQKELWRDRIECSVSTSGNVSIS